jgi:transcriptional regulator with XRE-family HTH domain
VSTPMSLNRPCQADRLRRCPVPIPASLALGLAVKARREGLGITQEQLSLRAELHQRWIFNVETGKRNPSYASIRRLATGLDVTASELIAKAEVIERQDSHNPSSPQE